MVKLDLPTASYICLTASEISPDGEVRFRLTAKLYLPTASYISPCGEVIFAYGEVRVALRQVTPWGEVVRAAGAKKFFIFLLT